MYGNVILVTVLKRLNYALALLLICLQLCQHALVYKSPLANPILYFSDAVSGWAGWTIAHPEFGGTVNPIPTRWGRLCPPHYCLPTRIGKPNGISVISNQYESSYWFIKTWLFKIVPNFLCQSKTTKNPITMITLLHDWWQIIISPSLFLLLKWPFPRACAHHIG